MIHGLTDTVATTAPRKEEIRTSNRPGTKVILCSEASNLEVLSQLFFRMPHRALSERSRADACRRSMRARHAARARPRAGAARRDGRARCKRKSEQVQESAAPIRIWHLCWHRDASRQVIANQESNPIFKMICQWLLSSIENPENVISHLQLTRYHYVIQSLKFSENLILCRHLINCLCS